MLNTKAPLNKVFKPLLNLTIYEATFSNDFTETNYYIEAREVKPNGKLGAAAPLKEETIENIASSFNNANGPKLIVNKILPSNLIMINQFPGQEKLIWLCKQSVRNLFFKKNIGIEDGRYPIPNLIFRWNGQLSVYAVKETKMNNNTVLYRAPYPNSGSNVCMGNAGFRLNHSMTIHRVIEEIENRFFGSYFSHTITPNSLIKGNYVLKYRSIKDTTKFPNEVLIKIKNKKLENIL